MFTGIAENETYNFLREKSAKDFEVIKTIHFQQSMRIE